MRLPSAAFLSLWALAICPASGAWAAEPAAAPPDAALWATEPIDAPPAAVRAAAKQIPAAPGDATTGLYSETLLEWLPDGHARSRVRLVSRVDARRGIDRLSRFGAYWQPSTTARPVLRARVIDAAGAAHAMDPKQFAETEAGQPSADVFSDTRLIAGPLRRVAVGAIVETESVLVSTGPVFASGVRLAVSIESPNDAVHRRIEWRTPAGMALTMAVVDSDVKPTVETVDGVDIWRVEIRRAPGERAAPEEKPPPSAAWDAWVAPRIVLGTTPDWAAAAAEYHGVVEAALKGGVEAALTVDLPRDDAPAAARQVAQRIWQRVRYTGVHFGRAAVIPRMPTTVLDDGFGDCKDMAVMFVGAMRAAGYDARVALVAATGVGIEASVPGLGAFDHAIARVEAEPPIWVDLTAPALPVGEVVTGLYGRKALIIGPETAGLTAIPRPPAGSDYARQTHVWRIDPEQPAAVTLIEDRRGAAAHGFRQAASIDPDTFTRALQGFMRSQFNTEAEPQMQPLAITRSPMVRISGSVESPLGWVDGDGAGLYYDLAPIFAFLPDAVLGPADDAIRAVHMETSVRRELVIRAEVSAGYEPAEVPEPGEFRMGPATLTVEKLETRTGPAWSWRLDSGPRRWSAEDVAAFRTAFAAFDTREYRRRLRFEHLGARAIAGGRIGEGLGIYRSLADGGPRAKLAYIDNLASNGYPLFARSLAEAFVEQHPERADGWASLGYARLNGNAGSSLAPLDYVGAAQAYRKALALEPGLFAAGAGLTVALAGDDEGWRADPAALEAAFEVARAHELRTYGPELALELGRPAEALKLIGTPKDVELGALFLAARALSGETDSGLAVLRGELDDAAFAQVAAQGLIELANLRAWDALRDLEARIRPELAFDATPFTRLKRHTSSAPETADAALAELLHHRLLGADDETLARYATPDVVAGLPGSLLDRQLDAVVELMSTNTGLGRAAMADGLMAEKRSTTEIQAQRLYVAAITLGDQRSLALVERSDEGFKVAGLPDLAPAAIGWRIADALKRGDQIGAQHWRLWSIRGTEAPDDPLVIWRGPANLAALIAAQAGGAPLELTAAALLSEGTDSDRARARELLAAGRRAEGLDLSPASPLHRILLALKLRLADGLPAKRAVLKPAIDAAPDDPLLAVSWARVHRDVGEHRAADSFLTGLPAELQQDGAVWVDRVHSALGVGDFERVDALAGAAMADIDWSGLRNDRAWAAAFRPDADLDAAIGWLEAIPPERRRRAHQHTLATLYGLDGRAGETRALLGRMLAESDRFEPWDWLVIGLLAEAEGLPDAARHAYERLPIQPDDRPSASSRIAARRLARLKAAR